jgi:hypothetical protein
MKKMHMTFRDAVALAVVVILTSGIFLLNFKFKTVI